jgi:membrane protein
LQNCPIEPRTAFHWRAIPALFADSASQWSGHNVPRLGAALAFYTLLSIAPLLVVVAAIGSLVFGSQAAQIEIARQVYAVAGPMGAKAVSSILNGERSASHGVLATVFGIIILFFGASSALIELREALNTIWDLPVARRTWLQDALNIVRERLFAFLLVLGVGFFLLLSLAVNVFVAAFARHGIPGSSLVSLLVVTGIFAVIFKFVPDVKLRWIEVLLGAFVTSLLFELGRLLIAFYLARADFDTTYGTAASTTALLVWVYYSSQIFFFGAAFTKVFAERFGSRS